MAPPNFPNGMTLHDIGIAALKYPTLAPPPMDVPLGNIVGALQHQPMAAQTTISDEPTLHDPSDPQYYFSTAILLLNYLTGNPDVCKRVVAHPTLVHDVIEKLLAPDFVTDMKKVVRPPGNYGIPPAKFDDDFGSILQFISTMLLYQDDVQSLHPRLKELIPKLKDWKKTYRNSPTKTIRNASERMVGQIQGMDPSMLAMMREMQEQNLVCGVASCRVRGQSQLTVCATCKIQRYCGRDHQKADWKYHKHICKKGLVETAEE